jgi:putative ABC transport system permease protein
VRIEVKMAWRNIWRNPRRTLLTISAISFACLLLVFMLSWQFGSYQTMINTSVKLHTGHLQIQARGYQEKRDIRLVVEDPAAAGALLETIPPVEAYTFRANAFSLASAKERTAGVMVVGFNPAREAEVSTLKQLIRRGSYLSAPAAPEALVGVLLAKNLRVDPGDELTLLGQGRDGSIAATVVKVRGIYESGIDEFDRSTVQIPLAYFQEVYSMRGAVHEVVVISRDLEAVGGIQRAASAGLRKIEQVPPLVALDWEELMPGLRQSIEMDLVSGLMFYLILIVVVAFSILNTFLMAVFERTKEFGVMMALGTTPRRLTRLLLLESTFMTLLGVALGVLLGSLITLYAGEKGIVIGGASDLLKQYGIPGRMYPRLSLLSASIGPAMVLAITFLVALYPALKIRGLKPVDAIKHI